LHAVFRHTLYGQVMAGQRQRLHHRVAERLATGFASEPGTVAAEVALHFERGGDPERAAEHLVVAAAGVRQRAGDSAAVAYFERALALVAALPESAQRDRQELELRLKLCREAWASVAIPAAKLGDSIARAVELCERVGDARSQAYASVYLTRSLVIQCKLGAAESLNEQRVERASALDDPILLASAHVSNSDIAFFRGEFECARREAVLCLSSMEGVDHEEAYRLLGHDVASYAWGRLGRTHWILGLPDEARRSAAAGRACAQALKHPVDRAFSLIDAMMVERSRRDANAARALAKSYVELSEEYGISLPFTIVYAMLSEAPPQSGEYAEVIARLRERNAANQLLGVRLGSSLQLGVLAEMELLRGRTKEGLAAIDEALAFADETGERFWEAEIHRLEGELRRLDGEDGPAEACFATALELARGQSALAFELRAATSLARLWLDTSRVQEARPLLADVYGRFREGFDTLDLIDAKVLLGSL
jgi:adenylate cyclase